VADDLVHHVLIEPVSQRDEHQASLLFVGDRAELPHRVDVAASRLVGHILLAGEDLDRLPGTGQAVETWAAAEMQVSRRLGGQAMETHPAGEPLAVDLGSGRLGGLEEMQRQPEHVVADPVTVAMPEGDLVPLVVDRAAATSRLIQGVDERDSKAASGKQCG
jgi:hypothetical protein